MFPGFDALWKGQRFQFADALGLVVVAADQGVVRHSGMDNPFDHAGIRKMVEIVCQGKSWLRRARGEHAEEIVVGEKSALVEGGGGASAKEIGGDASGADGRNFPDHPGRLDGDPGHRR